MNWKNGHETSVLIMMGRGNSWRFVSWIQRSWMSWKGADEVRAQERRVAAGSDSSSASWSSRDRIRMRMLLEVHDCCCINLRHSSSHWGGSYVLHLDIVESTSAQHTIITPSFVFGLASPGLDSDGQRKDHSTPPGHPDHPFNAGCHPDPARIHLPAFIHDGYVESLQMSPLRSDSRFLCPGLLFSRQR